jgi:hypothetical protein
MLNEWSSRRSGSSVAAGRAGRRGAESVSQPRALVHDVKLAFAHSTQTVFYIMAAVMAATFIIAVRRIPRGRPEEVEDRAPGDDLDLELSPLGPGGDLVPECRRSGS